MNFKKLARFWPTVSRADGLVSSATSVGSIRTMESPVACCNWLDTAPPRLAGDVALRTPHLLQRPAEDQHRNDVRLRQRRVRGERGFYVAGPALHLHADLIARCLGVGENIQHGLDASLVDQSDHAAINVESVTAEIEFAGFLQVDASNHRRLVIRADKAQVRERSHAS